jgi:hypothetical protein
VPIGIDIRNAAQAVRRLSSLGEIGRNASVRALNKSIRSARTASSTEIRKQVNLPKAYVDERLALVTANYSKLSAEISARSRGVLLSRYPYRELAKGRGISIRVKKGKPSRLPGGWTLALRRGTQEAGGATGIAVRVKGPGPGVIARKRGRKTDYYKVLQGPSVSQVFDTVRDLIEPEVRANFRRTLQHEVRFEARRFK